MGSSLKHRPALSSVNLSIHEAARPDGYADGWLTSAVSPAAEVSEIERIVERVRDLCRNGSLGTTLAEILTNKITQPAINLSIVDESKGRDLRRIKDLIYQAFNESVDLDFDEELNFQCLMSQLVEETVKAGGCLAIRVFEKDALLGYRIKLVEQSYIDRSLNEKMTDGSIIRKGIEYDAKGKKQAYWLFSHGFDDSILGKRVARRYLKKDVAHFYSPPRIGADIGLPWFSHLVPEIRTLEDFIYNTHIRNRNASAITSFIETNQMTRGPGDHSPGSPEFGEDLSEKDEPSETDDRGFAVSTRKKNFERSIRRDIYTAQFSEIRPGINYILRYGEKVTIPKVPDAPDFNGFYKPRLQSMARSTGGASYEDISGDYSNSSYSAARMSEAQPKLWIQKRREMLKSKVLLKIWQWTLEGLNLRGFNTSKIWHRWEMPDPPPINPKEDAAILQDLIGVHAASVSEYIRRTGRDPDAVFKEIAEERKMLIELGLLEERPKN